MVGIDKEGYLKNQADWTEEVAARIANREGIDNLTEKHWQIIYYIRDYYNDFNTVPPLHKISEKSGLNALEISRLFPKENIRSAYRVAGLPRLERF
ncbi:MAG: dissimilatory sulfite reductase related protein [Clostridia bacterium]|jgi:tRNA 2-thiouridine synthesizing protein E|nr:sulfur relay protein TusE/DsrC/DsvC family [Clostridiales bacterium]MDK2985440.1 dissimilatory sulfite reductase related protein [Clostridia bacterium]